MAGINESSQARCRNIIFFGETGTGKSSAINLISGSNVADVSNDAGACTRTIACYETTIRGAAFKLWDTRGLGEGFFDFLFRGSSEGELKKFLRARHQNGELDLLVYCVRGSRAHDALVKNYNTFCAITRRLAAPVVIVVTNLERENNMDGWWERNEPSLQNLGMEFDGHACIAALPGNPRAAVSRETLQDLISRNYRWQAGCDGSYFGSTVQRRLRVAAIASVWSTRVKNDARSGAARPRTNTTRSEAQSSPGIRIYDSSAAAGPSGKGKLSELWRMATLNRRAKQSRAGERSNSGDDSSVPQPSTPTSSRNYYSASDCTPQGSQPTTPAVQSAPRIQIVQATLPSISTNHPRDTVPLQPSSEESESTISCLHSMFHESSRASLASNSGVHSQPPVEDHEGTELPCKDLTAAVKRRKEYASRCGAFGDIWECDLTIGGNPQMVAVKAVRAQRTQGNTEDLDAQKKKLQRELRVWAKLRHNNVVQLLGVVSGFGLLPSMVSPWFNNGSLSSYLASHKTMNLSERQCLLYDIAAGLCYLHSQGVVHGDLHSDNVLVDDNGRACLTDFGLSLIIRDFVGTSYLKSSVCGAARYADPELVRQAHVEGSVVYPTTPSDIFSFGGLMLFVLSGKKPYEGIKEISVIPNILNGKRPSFPTNDKRIFPEHQSLIKRCWIPQEGMRPSANEIMALLHGR
ncbi:kinase-like protein [Gyrodon lividus]|nr:kinase-like protein [Gyrodon lividus]